MTRQNSPAPRRTKPRWLSLLILFAAIGMMGVVWNTHSGSQRLQADRRDFRNASLLAVPAITSVADAPNSTGDIRQTSGTNQSALVATLAVAESPALPADPHRSALQSALALLEKGRERLKSTNHYTATFIKQERVGDELTEGDVTEIKVRHEPFGVYMKWVECDEGQELLYVDGTNEGKLLLKQVGWKARLLPLVSLDPHCVLAMSQSRYPVTQMGLLRLVETLITDRRRDLETNAALKCQLFNDVVC